ncbi:hypothetical protein [Synechococcus sp. WH 8016]|uniref:hypothetical protein n=1 Tax=Synechococcus sp. WH 8016 TaxID=166318 RepID=UPI00022D7D94|nr:hypothetical protein [Synechococcus sp. WH 8016]EHA63800.1 hypothetical protein Syn8016DRAFT_0841 [Synechococcus sp. WH 8016]
MTTKSKAKTPNPFDASIPLRSSEGQVVAITVPHQDVSLISRYHPVFHSSDLKTFVKRAVNQTVRWMMRMINGSESFELETMDHWQYDPKTETLKLRNPGKKLRDYDQIFLTNFTRGNVNEYNQGMGQILSCSWYKIHMTPVTTVELIACLDILYRRHHNGISPASASGVFHTDIDATHL